MEQATADAATGGTGLNRLAVSATTHCLTGCAIGEVAGLGAVVHEYHRHKVRR